MSSKLLKTLWISFIAVWFLFILFIFSVNINLLGLFGGLPGLEILENPKSELASEIYSIDNVLLGNFFRQYRSAVDYEDISHHMLNAVLCTEDIRFAKHSGIDFRGSFRVLFKTIFLGRSAAGGGSTITQQLAKNLFRTRSKELKGTLSNIPLLGTIIIKVKEWITAIKIERSYTKKEIITMYLNTVSFGSNAFGIKVASRTFFSTSPKSLKLEQAAVLTGLLKAPTRYSPVLNPGNSLARRNIVFHQMYKYNYISKVQYHSIRTRPIELNYKVEKHSEGVAPYFRNNIVRKFMLNWCKEHGYDLFSDGLKIYTTIDSRMQRYAEQAIKEHLTILQEQFFEHWKGRNPWINENNEEIRGYIEKEAKKTETYRKLVRRYGAGSDSIHIVMNTPRKMKVFSWRGGNIEKVLSPMDSIRYFKHFLHTGFMSMDPHTGHIKAWVGGINYKYFQYDHVKQGKRQPGSTFKPIVYTAAIDNGFSPCHTMIDGPTTFTVRKADGSGDTSWTPKNSHGVFTGEMLTIRQGMARSVNSITARLMKRLKPRLVVEYGKRLGITSPLVAAPALCLGTCDVSVYELVGAYSTFVNNGIWTEPIYITRIEDKNGNVIREFVPKTREVLNEESAYLMIHMLKGSTEEKGGTALGLNRYDLRWDNEIGAKTGTTQNSSDGWFIGVLPQLVSGLWVGGEDRCIHFRTMEYGQGARMAMPIWALYMQKVYDDATLGITKRRFLKPTKKLSVELDCDSIAGISDTLSISRPVENRFEED
ncbi:MAG: penicillin-binding protein [Cytophagales bacterium]|nr:penicillin-binding protein [Cytophagales bacterium]